MKRRILSALMAVVVTITSIPTTSFPVFAAENTDVVAEDEVVMLEEELGEVLTLEADPAAVGSSDTGEENSGEDEMEFEIISQEIVLEESISETVRLDAENAGTSENGEAAVEEAETNEDETVSSGEIIVEGTADSDMPAVNDMTAIDLDTMVTADISTAGTYVWVSFTAEKEGTYYIHGQIIDGYIDSAADLYDAEGNYISYSDDDGGNGQFRFVVAAEAGDTYCVRARLYSAEATGQFKIGVSEYKTVSEITALSNVPEMIRENNSYYFGNVIAVLKYEDGSSAEVSVYSSDACGNYVSCSILKDGEAVDSDIYELAAGEYELKVTCCGCTYTEAFEIVTTKTYIENIPEDRTFTAGSDDEILLSSSAATEYEYKVTAANAGSYLFTVSGAVWWIQLLDENGKTVANNYPKSATDTEICVSAYISPESSLLLMLGDTGYSTGTDSFTLSSEQITAPVSMSVNVASPVAYTCEYEAFSVELTYADGSKETVELSTNQAMDSYGNTVWLEWNDDNSLGDRSVTVYCANLSETVSFQVVSRLEAWTDLPVISMPTDLSETLEIIGSEYSYVKVVSDSTCDYAFTLSGIPEDCGYWWAFYDANEMSVASGDNESTGIISLQAGVPYLFCLCGYKSDAAGTELGEAVLTFEKTKTITDLEISASEYIWNSSTWKSGVEIKVIYDKGTESESSEIVTGLQYYDCATADGRSVSCTFYSPDKTTRYYDYQLNYYSEYKAAYGDYIAQISCGSVTVDVPIQFMSYRDARILMAEPISVGSNALESSPMDEYFDAVFTAEESGYYNFVQQHGWVYRIDESSNWCSVPVSLYLEKGESVLFTICKYSTTETFSFDIYQAPPIETISLSWTDPLYGNGCLSNIQVEYTYDSDYVSDGGETTASGMLYDLIGDWCYTNTVTLYNSDKTVYDPNGNSDYYAIDPGTYTIEVKAGGATVNKSITIADEWSVLPQLKLSEYDEESGTYSSTTLDLTAGECVTYCFTADTEKTGEYSGYSFVLQNAYGYLYNKNGVQLGRLRNGTTSFVLEPGENYKVDLYLEAEDQESTAVVYKTEPVTVADEDVKVLKSSLWAKIGGLNDDDIQVTYTDGNGEKQTLSGDETDENGYWVYSYYYESDGNGDGFYDEGETYTCVIYFAGQRYERTISVVNPGEDVPEIEAGTSVVVPGSSMASYRFVAPETAAYLFKGVLEIDVFDENLNHILVSEGDGNQTLNAEQGKTYYIHIRNTFTYLEQEFSVESLESVCAVSVIQSQSSIPSGVPFYPTASTVLGIYEAEDSEEPDTILYSEGEAIADSNGSQVTAVVKQGESVITDYEEGLEAGEYTVELSYCGKTTSYSVTAAEQDLTKMSEGTYSLNSSGVQYYKLNTNASGYRAEFGVPANVKLYNMTSGEWCIWGSNAANHTLSLEGGMDYCFICWFDPEDVNGFDSVSLELTELIEPVSLEIASCDTSFLFGDISFVNNLTVTTNYTNNDEVTWHADNNGWVDKYGNALSCWITDGEGNDVSYNDLLPVGTYTVTLQIGYLEPVAYTFKVVSRTITTLTEGTTSVTVPAEEEVMLQLPAESTDKLIVEFADALSYDYVYERTEDSQLWVSSSWDGTRHLYFKNLSTIGNLYLILKNESQEAITLDMAVHAVENRTVDLVTDTIPSSEPIGWRSSYEFLQAITADITVGTAEAVRKNLYSNVDEEGYYYSLGRPQYDEYGNFWVEYVDLSDLSAGTYEFAVMQYWGYSEDEMASPEFTLELVTNEKAAWPLEESLCIEEAQAGTWYLCSYTPEYAGSYTLFFDGTPVELKWMSASEQSVQTESGLQEIFGGFELEADETYYFRFRAQEITESDCINVSILQGDLSFSADLNDGDLSVSYTGEAIEPEVTVVNGAEKVLTEGTHYELSYSNNVNASTEYKKATVTVNGLGVYAKCEPVVLEFTILPMNMENLDIQFADNAVSYGYLPDGCYPKPIVKHILDDETEIILQEETDYTLTYDNNLIVSTDTLASVTVTANDYSNYTGSQTLEFEIIGRDAETLSISFDDESVSYTDEGVPFFIETGMPIEPAISVTFEESGEQYTLDPIMDYEVSYSNNYDPGTAQIVITPLDGVFTEPITRDFVIAEAESLNVKNLTAESFYADLYETEEITAPAAGIQWYEWTSDAQESFLIDPDFDEDITDTAKDAAFRIYQKDASTGNLYRVSSMLYPGDDYDTSILTAGTGASYYIRISSDADKVRIVKAAEISQDADCLGQGTASVFTGVSAWTLVPNESGTYSFYASAGKTLQVYMIYEDGSGSGYEPLDELVLTYENGAAAGEYGLTAGVTYLFIWNDANSEDTSRTLTAELTEPEIVKLEDNSTNEVYVPYGRTSVFELPAMTAGVRRYICGYDTDGAYVAGVTYYIGTLEDADSIVASVTGDSFPFVIPEGSETSETLYLTVTNNSESQDAVEALELGLVPEVSIAVDTSRLPYPVLEGWEDLAAELAVLEVTYGEDESAEYETDSFRIKDAADRFGFSWSVELEEESEIEHAYAVYTSWNGIKNESADVTFAVESVSADNVPVLARNYAEGGSFPGEISWENPSTFRFVPVVDGSYELALQKPAWIYLSADEEPELVYSRTIEVTKGTEVVLLIVPQENDDSMCGYRLKRVSEAAPGYEISYTDEGSGYVFCGDYIEPEFDVVDSESGYVLEEGTDYTFNEYYNNYNAGYGQVYLTGMGEYAALGQTGYSFQISKANLNDVTFPDSVAYEYTGDPITYDENGTMGSYTLYPWYYTVNAGEANTTDVADFITVTLEANESGNFTGTKTVTFSITQKTFTEADAKAIQYKDSVVYTGEPVNPIEQIVLNGKTLLENEDYTVTYADDHTNAGWSSLTITGKGNYTGSFTDSFYISPRTFDETDELLEIQPIQPQTYTSKALTPVPVIKYNGNILVNGTDFEVDYANNTEITNDNLASVIITGKGNYDGTLTSNFAIVNETVESSEITAEPMKSGTVYKAADSETWYSITADEMDLVYLKLSGEYASNARIFQLTENGTIWDRLWLDPETYTVNEAEWLIPVEAGMALAVAVPENTAFEGRTATDLSENTPIQTAADQGGWNIYRVTADQTGVYGIFAEQAGEIQVLDETLNSVVSTANGNYTTTASDTDGIAAKYEYVYRMNLSGSSLSSDTVVIAIPSGSGSYELSYFPDIVSIEVVESENVNNTYRRLDSEFFEGISFKVTYEDNTTVNLVPGNLDGWGRSFEKHLLLVGGELTYPAGTALYEGDYKRIIRYTDRYQQEYGAKEISDSVITVLSMEDSYTENTFVSGVPMVLKTEQAGSTEIYVIDAQRDWKYLIEGTQAVAIQFVDEDGYFGEIISGSEFELELEAGTYYLYIQTDLQSAASAAEETGDESVENGNENTSVSVTVTEKAAPDQIRYVQAYPDVYAIGVSWGTATKIGTIYDLYRSPVNDAGEATEFELLTTITNRSTTYYRDADFTAEELDQEFAYYVVARDGKYVVSEPSEVVKCEPGTDNIAPVVKSLTPESGKRLNKTFTITSYATDNVAVDHMELYIRNSDTETWTLLNTFAGSSFSYALDTTNYPDGTYYVKAIAYDAVNNASAAFENKYQFDNTAPEKVQNVTSECTSATITLHWSDVADQDLAYFLVEEKDSFNNWVKAGETSTTLGMKFTNLAPDVTHTYRVKAVDKLGNVGEPSEEISVTTLSDTTAPVISGLNPKEGRYKDSITFTVTGTDEYAIRKLEIQYSQDTAEEKVWTQLAVSEEFAEVQKVRSLTGTLDIQELNLTEGAVFLRGVAWDMAGNQSEITAAAPFVEFTVDQTAPAAPTATATAGDGYIEIRWEQGAEEDLGYYEVYKRTTGEENSFALLKNGLNTVNWYDRDVEGGETYYYMVKVSDTAGNVSAASDIVSVVAVVDEEAPVIQSVNPSDGNTFAAVDAENIQISALVSDNRCLSEISIWYKYSETADYTDDHKVTSSNINDYWYVATAEVPLGYEADGLTKTIEDGQSIYLKVTAKDTSGNEAEPIELTCIADKAAPEIKSAAVAFGAENREIRISWTGGQEADLLGYYVYRSVNDGSWEMVDSEKAVVLEDETVAADYQFVDNALSTSGGTYSYKIEALDQLGNTGSLVIEEFITVEALEEDMILTPPTADLQCENLMEIHAEYLFDASGSTGESEITSYTFDFGDGEAVSTTKSSFIHNYAKAGTYTVKVTVVDVNGCEGTCERVVTVREPSTLGNVEVTVVDYDGNPVANAPVYFDLGSSNQFVRNTDYSGKVTITAGVGTHSFGCYKDGYLPVQSEVLLLSGETVKAELAIKEEPLVTGEFEIHRMTLDEIVAAGIDVTDPENQYVAKVTVHMVYEEAEIDFDFNVNGIGGIWKPKPVKLKDRIVYPIFIPGPDPIGGGTGGGGGGIIGGGGGSTATVALLDIPVGVSILKEFFDVKLHILNHADSSFCLLDNDITLNVPSGLKIMQTNVSLPSNQVHIDEIKGGTQETLKWIIRGDEVGSYALTADFAGTLSTFNTRVEAQFEAEDPIEVYGLSKGRLTITIPEVIGIYGDDQKGLLDYTVSFANEGSVPMYLPKIWVRDSDEHYQTNYFKRNGEMETLANVTDYPQVLEAGEALELLCYMDAEGYELYELQDWYVQMYGGYGIQVDVNVLGYEHTDSSIVITDAMTDAILAGKEIYLNGNSYTTDGEGCIYPLAEDITGDTLEITAQYFLPYTVEKEKILGENGTHKVRLQVDDGKGEPFVESFYYRQTHADGEESLGAWKDGLLDALTVYEDSKEVYRLELKANWNGNEAGTYTIQQSYGGKLENDTGIFTDVQLNSAGFKTDRPFYVFVTDANGVSSAPIRTKITFQPKERNPLSLFGGSLELGSSLKVTIPEDFPLIGGDEIELDLDDFPLFVKAEGYEVQVGINMNVDNDDDWNMAKKYFSKMDESNDATKNALLADQLKKKTGATTKVKKFLGDSSLEVSLIGYATFTYTENGNFEVTGGSIAVSIDLNGAIKEQLIKPPVFFVLKFGTKVGASGTVEKPLINSDLPFRFNLELYFAPYLKATAGVGIKDVIAVELTGGVETKITWNMTSDYTRLVGKADVVVKAYIGPFTFLEETLAEKEKVLYESSSAKTSSENLDYVVSDMVDETGKLYTDESGEVLFTYEEMLGMVYNTEYYAAEDTSYDYKDGWNAELVEKQEVTEEPDLEENEQLLQDHVYPDARQMILETDDTRMMIWLSQDGERAAQNSTLLVYSLYDEQTDTWGTPTPVVDDGTADMYPQAKVKEDTIYVIWQNTSKVLGDEEKTLADLAANTEIATAYYHEEAGRFITIDTAGSESGESYSDPKIAAEGTDLYSVWIANSEQDLFGTTGANSILAARMTETGWSSPQTLASGLSMIAAYDAAVVDGTLRVAASLDTDDSVMTSEDWEIFEYTWTSDDKFEQKRITQNTVEDDSPYYAKESGRSVLYWNSNDQTARLYLDDSTNTGETLELAVGTGRKQVETANGMYLFWIGNSTKLNEANEIYCAAFEESTGTYGDPVAVTDSGRFITSFQAQGNKDGSIDLVYQARPISMVEVDDAGIDGNETGYEAVYGNSRFYRQNILPDADLAVYDNGNIQAGMVYPGAAFEFDLTLANEGMFPADGYLIQILDESGKAVVTKNYYELLQPGEEQNIVIPYLLPLDFVGQTYTVRAVFGAGTESRTENNSLEVPITGKEILIQSVQTIRSGSNVNCIVKAKNMGSVDVTNIYLEVREDSLNGKLLSDPVQIGDLLFGEYDTWTYTVDLTKLSKEGTTRLYFIAKEILTDEEGNTSEGVSDRSVTAVYASSTTPLEMEAIGSLADDDQSAVKVTALIQNDAIVAQEEDVAAIVYSDTGVVIGYQKETLTVGAGRTLRYTFAVPVTELPKNWTAEVIPMIPAESVKLYLEQDGEETEITETPMVREEYTLQLSAVVAPDEAIDHAVTWSSSDESIATVSETGLVTGVKAGTVTITAEVADGYGAQAECEITVRTKHIWSDDDWTETTAPTCTEPAVETRECLDEDCTETESRTGRDALGHTGGTATCQSQAVCEVCQTSYGELGDHAGGEATCQNQAVCEVCQTPYGELGDHRGGTATCQDKAVCSVCSQEYGKLSDHDYDTEWTVDTPATCTTAGSKSHHCKTAGCDSVKDSTSVPALGHTGGTATCTKQAVCTRCNTAYGNLKAHTGGTATCQSKAVCSVCGSSYGALGAHNFSTAWTIDVQATCLAAGSRSHHCTVEGCTAISGSEAVPKLKGTIKLTAKKLPIQLKKTANLKSIVTGLSEGDYITGWKSSNTKIVTVNSSGKITGKKLGTATITVTLASGASASVKVTVQKKAVATTKVSVESTKITLNKGKSITLKPVLAPVTSLEKVTYKTSNKKVATVTAKGKITAKASGRAVITVKAGRKTVKVTVTVPKVQPTKITGVPTKRNLKVGKSLTLKPKLLPAGAEATIKYSTSSKKIATVTAKGKITAKKKGTAVITVTAGKIKVQCTITVK